MQADSRCLMVRLRAFLNGQNMFEEAPMNKISVKELCRAALIAAAYFAISVVLLPFAFGAVQVRAAEALTLLPVLSPVAVWGVTLGCAITNSYGIAAGMNILGAIDVLLGSAATLVAALMTRRLRHIRWNGLPVLAALPPIFVNAAVIGTELTFAMTGRVFTPLLAVNMLQVGAGQAASCLGLGLLLVKTLEQSGILYEG